MGKTPAVDFRDLTRHACGAAVRPLGGARHRSAEELRAKIREVPDFPKPGILFYDITTLLKDAAAYKEAIDLMLEPFAGERIDIVGMESRGFIFSAPMAYQLDAGLVPVRKLGKPRPRRSPSSTRSSTARTPSRSTATPSPPASAS